MGHGSLFIENFYKTMHKAAEDICKRIVSEIKGDYVIYGHSMGSIIAFETVYKLKKQRDKLFKNLILSRTPPPHLLYKDKKYTYLSKDEFMRMFFSK